MKETKRDLKRTLKCSVCPTTFTKEERRLLLLVKSVISFLWGFINAVIFLLAERFVTIQTGNLLVLAIAVKDWKDEQILITSIFIFTYVLFGALYDVVRIKCKEDEDKILKFLVSAVIPLGILADVLQHFTKACHGSSEESCLNNKLYFLTPISAIAGLIAAGYFPSHPDSIISTLMTGHMRVPTNTVVQLLMTKNMNHSTREVLLFKFWTSVFMVSSAFVGALFGAFSSVWVKRAYENDIFIPIFTTFGFAMSLMCTIHCKSCSKFYEYHREARRTEDKRDALSYSVVRLTPMETFQDNGEDDAYPGIRDMISIDSDLESFDC